jgi:hypothetical protein
MRAIDIRAKHPRTWDSVKSDVMEDLRLQKKIHKLKITEKAAEVIAHNAAFFATRNIIVIDNILAQEIRTCKDSKKTGLGYPKDFIAGLVQARLLVKKAGYGLISTEGQNMKKVKFSSLSKKTQKQVKIALTNLRKGKVGESNAK